MPLLGSVKIGSTVQIRFTASSSNSGSVSVLSGWVEDGTNAVPPSQTDPGVIAGMSIRPHTFSVPRAIQLRVTIAGGDGHLEVLQDGSAIADSDVVPGIYAFGVVE